MLESQQLGIVEFALDLGIYQLKQATAPGRHARKARIANA